MPDRLLRRVLGEAGFQKECNEAKCDECTFDSDPTDTTCDNTPLPNGNPGTCNQPELCMAGQCTNPGTCGGGVYAPDCSASAPAENCPAEASCAGSQYNCDCRL